MDKYNNLNYNIESPTNFNGKDKAKYQRIPVKVTLKEFLHTDNSNELTDKLVMFDKSIMELHQNGYFVVSDMSDIDIIDNQITLESFKNKVDYLNSGYNENGDKQDILEICAIGICAYNRFDKYYTNREFISYLIENLEMFLENGNVPQQMQEYYIDVFARGNIDYLNNFLMHYSKDDDGRGNNVAKVYTKSTAIGKAFSERQNEAAYTKILLLPAILLLVSLIVFFVYFIFFR